MKYRRNGFYSLLPGAARRTVMQRIAFIFILLAVIGSSVSCGSKTAAKTTTTNVTSTTTQPVTTTTTTTPKVTTTPALTTVSFALLLTPPQTSAEYTLPVYLTADSILHLDWTVTGVGDAIRLSINTPDGKLYGVKTKGGFATLTSDDPCDQLNRIGSIVLKPSTQKWVDGYYVFHPYICDDDPGVSVKLIYWVEH